MLINTVTITGADDSIESDQLSELSEEFPFVEWGILLSGSQIGGYRFPSEEWIRDVSNSKLRLSGHICGQWVRDILAGNGDTIPSFVCEFLDSAKRVQLNTHAEPHELTDQGIAVLVLMTGKQIIVQFDGVNEGLYKKLKSAGVDARPLYDLSGGAGIVPDKWLPPVDKYSGYAGGLGAENLEGQLDKIEYVVGDNKIWIDMETRVRSDNDSVFDLDKVRACLEIVAPRINPL